MVHIPKGYWFFILIYDAIIDINNDLGITSNSALPRSSNKWLATATTLRCSGGGDPDAIYGVPTYGVNGFYDGGTRWYYPIRDGSYHRDGNATDIFHVTYPQRVIFTTIPITGESQSLNSFIPLVGTPYMASDDTSPRMHAKSITSNGMLPI